MALVSSPKRPLLIAAAEKERKKAGRKQSAESTFRITQLRLVVRLMKLMPFKGQDRRHVWCLKSRVNYTWYWQYADL